MYHEPRFKLELLQSLRVSQNKFLTDERKRLDRAFQYQSRSSSSLRLIYFEPRIRLELRARAQAPTQFQLKLVALVYFSGPEIYRQLIFLHPFSEPSKSEHAVSESDLIQGCQIVNSDLHHPSLPHLLAQHSEPNNKELQIQPMRDHFSGISTMSFTRNNNT